MERMPITILNGVQVVTHACLSVCLLVRQGERGHKLPPSIYQSTEYVHTDDTRLRAGPAGKKVRGGRGRQAEMASKQENGEASKQSCLGPFHSFFFVQELGEKRGSSGHKFLKSF